MGRVRPRNKNFIMSSFHLFCYTKLHRQIKSFIVNNILIGENLSKAKFNDTNDDLFFMFSKIVQNNADYYFNKFSKQYLTDKKLKSFLFLDARYLCVGLLKYPLQEFYDMFKVNKLKTCFEVVAIGTLNALKHDGVFSNKVYKYHKSIDNIAINKLKRNKIVNEGILLKLSMKNCGLF